MEKCHMYSKKSPYQREKSALYSGFEKNGIAPGFLYFEGLGKAGNFAVEIRLIHPKRKRI